MAIGVDSSFAADAGTTKEIIDNIKETDSSNAREAFILIFKVFHRNNLEKCLLKGIVSKKLELSPRRVLETSNFQF